MGADLGTDGTDSGSTRIPGAGPAGPPDSTGHADGAHPDGSAHADGADPDGEHADSQRDHRLAKIEAMRQKGRNPYPYRYAPDTTLAEIRHRHADLAPGQETEDRVCVAGRITLIRRQGGLTFATIRDRTDHIQLFVNSRVVGPEVHADFDELDRGDWVGVEGTVMTTRRGELSVKVGSFALLGKAIRPPADKVKGLGDVETRYRQRYVDLIANERTRQIFDIRRKAIAGIRAYLEGQGFWEVEGPMLQTIQGGASARPFITHHNALNLDLYLRIALELHLKRLIVGGMERVYELGRVFRNEGIDTRHNPEFTMLEAYQAYADYSDIMDLTEGIILAAARAALGDDLTVQVAGQALDLTPPYPRITMAQLIKDALGVEMHPGMALEAARNVLDQHGVPWERDWGAGKCMKALYDEKVQHSIRGPVLCMDYPKEVSPLARTHRDDPAYVERFELLVAGFELCNAYSEQNNPAEQLAAFEAEARAKQGGDPEAGDIDYDYVRALEYGMPCTGGLGIGIDRLLMLLSGADSIREVILFPTLRPEFSLPPELTPPPRGPAATSSRDGAGAAGAAGARLAAVATPGGTLPAGQPGAPPGAPAGRAPGSRLVRWVANLTGLGGVLMLLTLLPFVHTIYPPFRDPISPLWFRVTGHVVTTVIGVALIFLASQLAKRKRTAWQISVGLFGLGTVTNVLKGPHLVAVAYCAVMTVGLVRSRRYFRAPADPPSLFRLVRLVPAYVAAVLLFGAVSLWSERDHVSPALTVGGALLTTVKGLVGVSGQYTYEREFFSDFFPTALLTLGIVGLVGFAVLAFRPLRARHPHTADDWQRAERLVHTYGWDTLAYFALRDDKSFFFAADGNAMLAYTYVGGYALVSGDPIGAPESIPRVLDEFLTFCQERAWKTAFLAVREADMPMYEARGYRSFYLGDEAIIACGSFTLDGREMKGVRAAVRRVGKRYRFSLVRESQASPTLVGQLNAISEKWRGKAPERGFTMSLSQDVRGAGANEEFLLCLALDEHNVPGGFLRLVPAYGADFGYTLDLMRHDPDAPNGMTDFLIASTALALKDRRVERLSMNFAVWGRLFQSDVSYTPMQKVAKRLVQLINPFFQIESLHDYNAKFFPQWLPRVLVYREPTDLPKVGLLYAGAEGFLAIPGVGELFVPKAVGGELSPSTPQRQAA